MARVTINVCEHSAKLLELKEAGPEAYGRQMLVYTLAPTEIGRNPIPRSSACLLASSTEEYAPR